MSKILKIIIIPNPILRKKSKKIDLESINTSKFKKLCDDMVKTMNKKNGVGLAAPQIGKNICLIVVRTKDYILHMINPKITKKSILKEFDEEGCLSVPNFYGKIKRNKKITCVYFDKKQKKQKIKAEGLLARVIQHEIDHLNGILFIDKNVKELKSIKQ